MARLFTRASSEYLSISQSPIVTEPFTFACWFFLADVTNHHRLFVIEDDQSSVYRYSLSAVGSVAGDPVRVNCYRSTMSNADSTSGYTASKWHHACGVIKAENDKKVYLDGGNSGTDTTAHGTSGTIDMVNIGVWYQNGGLNNPSDGRIAEAAIYNAALTENEVARLAQGYSPLLIRPDALVAYWPLFHNDVDYVGKYHMTPYNSPSWAIHKPGIIYPNPRISHVGPKDPNRSLR